MCSIAGGGQYNSSKSSSEFFEELKTIGLVPKNVNLHFLIEKQLTLEGQYYTSNQIKQTLISEAVIDTALNPIILESYCLKDAEGNLVDLDYLYKHNPSLMNLIESYKSNQKDNYILFPAGSISNLFPVLNVLHPLLRSLNLLIIHISNAFEQANEQKLQFQIERVHSLFQGQPFVVFGVSKNPFDLVSSSSRAHWEHKYKLESKVAVSQTEVSKYIAIKNINSTSLYIPNLRLIESGNPGLKYPTAFLDELISKTILNWKNSDNIEEFIAIMKRFIPNEYKNLIYPYLVAFEQNLKLNLELK